MTWSVKIATPGMYMELQAALAPVAAEAARQLRGLELLAHLLERCVGAQRLAVHCVLKAFDHGLEVEDARFQRGHALVDRLGAPEAHEKAEGPPKRAFVKSCALGAPDGDGLGALVSGRRLVRHLLALVEGAVAVLVDA